MFCPQFLNCNSSASYLGRVFNVLKMEDIKLALTTFSDIMNRMNALMHIDNISTMCYLNRQGGTRCLRLCKEARVLWSVASDIDVTPQSSQIAGKQNLQADKLSC